MHASLNVSLLSSDEFNNNNVCNQLVCKKSVVGKVARYFTLKSFVLFQLFTPNRGSQTIEYLQSR